jgi:hypothetical protein
MIGEGPRYTLAHLQLLPAFIPPRQAQTQALAAKAKFAFGKAKHRAMRKAP